MNQNKSELELAIQIMVERETEEREALERKYILGGLVDCGK